MHGVTMKFKQQLLGQFMLLLCKSWFSSHNIQVFMLVNGKSPISCLLTKLPSLPLVSSHLSSVSSTTWLNHLVLTPPPHQQVPFLYI